MPENATKPTTQSATATAATQNASVRAITPATAAPAPPPAPLTPDLVRQQLQQRIQERIQLKNQQELHQHALIQQLRHHALQEEESALHRSMTQQHLLQYQAMLRDLELQSALPTLANGGASLEDMDRLRQEALQRLQQLQFQKLQQQFHTPSPLQVTLTGVPPESLLQRQHLQMEQERMRLLQMEQHRQQPTTTTTTTDATKDDASQKKKRKPAKSPSESQMEALVRALCRFQVARTDAETRTSLEKIVMWVHRCLDVCLLRFALRDFIDIVRTKLALLEQMSSWLTEIQPKCTYVQEKLKQVITALQSQQQAKDLQEQQKQLLDSAKQAQQTTASNPSTDKEKTSAVVGGENDAIRISAREHAYAALKEQTLATMQQQALQRAAQPKKKRPLTVDVSLTHPDGKKVRAETPADAPKSVTAPLGIQSTSAPSAPTVVAPTTSSTPSAPISPRVAQHLFDLDLATRSCVLGPDEGEERLYFPLKPVANIMRKVLPGGDTGRKEKKAKRGKQSGKAADDEDDGDDAEDEEEHDEEKTHADDGDDGDEIKGKAGKSGGGPELAVKVDDAAAVLMQECVSEFLLFLTSEARDYSMMEKKKTTITGTHVVQATQNLGFTSYAKVLGRYNDKIRKMQDDQAQKKLEKKLLAKQAREEATRAAQAAAAAAAAAAASASVNANGAPSNPGLLSSGGSGTIPKPTAEPPRAAIASISATQTAVAVVSKPEASANAHGLLRPEGSAP
ncbi:hypothetical protein Poli38472_013173 [Pythium oligandrum]|uniref:Transcription factor CBF/NF-Y/archaeal histone domain-containing protein n=1 Tax=Pythium oligandrum TaxID=41045 RepID=A0A8K1C2J9_PYTOL|nr:hypothetical protein Poli38472_013173 [Pythium oligandrum]|eukprot:TMW55282.1 hypothetical protein Poli38472_013173 [Pythium oligandrum]